MNTSNTHTEKVAENAGVMKRTTLYVDEALWADVRIAAIQRGISGQKAIEIALRRWLDAGSPMDHSDRPADSTAS